MPQTDRTTAPRLPGKSPRSGESPGSHGLSSGSGQLTLTRRVFLGSVAAASGVYLVGCTPDRLLPPDGHHDHLSGGEHPGDEVLRFFTEHEGAVVDAIVARIVPGTPEDPGAREAGVLFYIDGKLSTHETFAEPTYVDGPFAVPAEQGASVADDEILVSEDQLYRYGFQSSMLPRELYRGGIAAVDELSRALFGAGFVAVTDAQQDELLTLLDDIREGSEPADADEAAALAGGSDTSDADDDAPEPARVAAAEDAFGEIDPGDFFDRVRTDTIEGMFADPSYGGNRDLIGWALIGYPGPRRAWSPDQMLAVGVAYRPQTLEMLPPMNPDLRDSPEREALEQPREGVADG